MRQKILLFLALLLCGTPIWSQKLNNQQREQVIRKIASATSSMKTMQCEFKQTKKMKMLKNEMKSSGIMYFRSPNKLRWQYNTPYSYMFVMSGNKVSLKSSKGTQKIDTQRNKMFRQISDIILGCVTGGSLKSSTDFNVEIWRENGSYVAKLFPKKKELKSLYCNIKIKFNSSLTMVQSVEMNEKSGDTTIVTLLNVKANNSINESVFDVN